MNMEQLKIAIKAVQIYAETHPRPSQVNQMQAAQMLGISSRTIYTMIKDGRLTLNHCGMIPITEIDRVIKPVA